MPQLSDVRMNVNSVDITW